jgi:hypothetical protein
VHLQRDDLRCGKDVQLGGEAAQGDWRPRERDCSWMRDLSAGGERVGLVLRTRPCDCTRVSQHRRSEEETHDSYG